MSSLLVMENSASYKIYFVNDSAAAIDFGNVIDKEINAKAIALFHYLTQHPIEGMIEAIPGLQFRFCLF